MPRIVDGPLGPERTEDGDFIAGRYSIIVDPDNVFSWVDLHVDFAVEVYLAGRWIAGHIRHTTDQIYAIERPKGLYHGYYFEAEDGMRCGLCTDMRVRMEV